MTARVQTVRRTGLLAYRRSGLGQYAAVDSNGNPLDCSNWAQWIVNPTPCWSMSPGAWGQLNASEAAIANMPIAGPPPPPAIPAAYTATNPTLSDVQQQTVASLTAAQAGQAANMSAAMAQAQTAMQPSGLSPECDPTSIFYDPGYCAANLPSTPTLGTTELAVANLQTGIAAGVPATNYLPWILGGALGLVVLLGRRR